MARGFDLATATGGAASPRLADRTTSAPEGSPTGSPEFPYAGCSRSFPRPTGPPDHLRSRSGEPGPAPPPPSDEPTPEPRPAGKPGRPTPSPLPGRLVFGLFLALFSATYFPTLRAEYGVSDDYRDLVTEALDPPEHAADPESGRGLTPGRGWKNKVAEGRPLFALATRLIHGIVSEIEHLRYVRFLGVLGICLLAWSLCRLLAGAGHDRFRSFCVAAIACSTLPFQVWAHWAVAATFPWAAALSGFAFLLADRASSPSTPPARKWSLTAGAVALLVSAFALYQPAAMFYCVFAAVGLLAPERVPRDGSRRPGRHAAIVAAGAASSYGLAVLGTTLYPAQADRTDLVSNIPGQLKWFLLDAFHYAPNFAVPSPSRLLLPAPGSPVAFETADRVVAWVVVLVVSWGLLRYLRTAGGEARWRYLAAVLLLAASFLPVLAPEVHSVRYRMLAAPSALIVLYAYFGLEGLRGFSNAFQRRLFRRFVVGAAAVASLLAAAGQVRVGLVEPQVREMEFLRSELAKGDLSRAGRIHLLRPAPGATLAPLRQLEFGRPSSHVEGVSKAMVFLVLREIAPAQAGIPVTSVRFDEPGTPPPGSFVVDLRHLGTP